MMRPPPFMLGMALLFWGWRTGMLWIGALAGALLELSNAVRSRWDFSDTEFNRLWDICTVLFVAAAAYLRFSEDVTSAAYKFFEWMPMIFFPMALGHVFSEREGVPLKAFSWLLRRRDAQGGDRPIAFGWIYFTLCLITAGATNARDIWFFAGVAALNGMALFAVRPRRMPAWLWCIVFGICAGGAFAAQARIPEVQLFLENKISELFVHLGRREYDAERARTAMGRIGALKQSSRIVMKVKRESGPVPERLRQSTYSKFELNTWRGSGRSFEHVPLEPDTTTWTLLPSPHKNAVRIIQRADRRAAFLSVPLGTVQLKELASTGVQTNRYQVILAEGNPGLLDFVAWTGADQPDSPPWSWDTDIPDEEADAINAVAREIGMENAPHDRQIEAIVNYFERNFRYTTYQQARELGLHNSTPLSDFLLKTRAGHCEYFASATVLLLRHYKIPARYATGYAVQELSREDDSWVIRERHGHAWAMAYVNKRWLEVDSTPPGWEQAEQNEFPMYEGLEDEWQNLTFGFLQWRWLGDWSFFRLAAPWLVLPLTGFLVWRIFGRRMKKLETPRESRSWPGADSEFFLLERKLARAGLARDAGESGSAWAARVSPEAGIAAADLRRAILLHYRYRFDPDGMAETDRAELRRVVTLCLAEIR